MFFTVQPWGAKVKFWRKLHKWIGLVIGIQVLLWISGGVVMSIIPIDMVRGKHLVKPLPEMAQPLASEKVNFQPDLSHWKTVEWRQRLGQAALVLTGFDGERQWVDPASGQVLPVITADEAKQVAALQYLGEGEPQQVRLLTQLPQEVSSRSGPLYRVDFNDWIHTSLYLDPASGEVKSVRSDYWRLFDFFWMLHIMDYEEREDFNNPLLIGASLLALFFTFSGLVLLYFAIFKPKTKKLMYHAGLTTERS